MSNNRFSFISQAKADEPAIDNEDDGVPSLLPLRISFPPLSPLLKKLLINQSHLLTIDHNMDDSDSSGDDESLISLYRTNYFIQDAMMYKPWKIFPPSQKRGTYVCQLHPWLLYRSRIYNEMFREIGTAGKRPSIELGMTMLGMPTYSRSGLKN
jgi:hypothetical protein